MFNRIEELESQEQKLETTMENLTELGALLPTDGVVVVNLENGLDDISFPIGHIENGIKEALGLPLIPRMNFEKGSVILFDDGGRKGLFLASRVPEKQCRIGLPGFISDDSRFHYGAIWSYPNDIEIYSNIGNSMFDKESHPLRQTDLKAIYMLCFVLSKAVLQEERDDETGEVRKRLSNVRVRDMKNSD